MTVPVLFMAVLAILDLLARPEFVYLPLLSLALAFAASRLPAVQVVAVGCVGVALWHPMVRNDELSGSSRGMWRWRRSLGRQRLGRWPVPRAGGGSGELSEVRAVAEMAGQVLLRRAPSRMGQFQIAARYASAAASARIGGDLYDVIPSGRRLRLLVGDVQGEGLPAVATASIVLGAFREIAYDAPSLVEISHRIEVSLERQAVAEEFVTALLAAATSNC